LTLAQTQKIESKIVIVLYGSEYWKEILNFDALVKYGTIAQSDLDLFQYADTAEEALDILQVFLTKYYLTPEPEACGRGPGNRPIPRVTCPGRA